MAEIDAEKVRENNGWRSVIRRIWQNTLDLIAPMKPCDLSRLDRLDGLHNRTETI